MTTEQLLKQISRRLSAIERHLKAVDETMMTSKQAAAELGCSTGALRMRAIRGTIPCTRSNTGRLYFKKSDILKHTNAL